MKGRTVEFQGGGSANGDSSIGRAPTLDEIELQKCLCWRGRGQLLLWLKVAKGTETPAECGKVRRGDRPVPHDPG